MGSCKVLFIGEIVGKAGVFCVKSLLPQIRQEHDIAFVVADGEGATGGFGIGRSHSIYLHKLGIDCITSGECIYYKKDMVGHIVTAPYILRPANYPQGNPGRGWMIYVKNERKLAVISLLGQSGFPRVHLKNPVSLLPKLVERIVPETCNIIVDFHAVATAEKYCMFYAAEGSVSAVIGTHTKVATADEAVLPGGTAVITDAGMTGSSRAVGGLDPEVEIRKHITQIHEYSQEVWDGLELQGVIVEIGEDGKAVGIQRIRVPCTATPEGVPDSDG